MNTPIVPRIVVAVTGSLDAATLPRWRQRLEDAVTAVPAHLVVDLTRCGTVDETGVALLADAHRTVSSGDGGRLTLRGLSLPLCVLLQAAQLDDILQHADRPSGYRPRHRRQRHRARQTASQRQSDELRWWLAPTTDGAR